MKRFIRNSDDYAEQRNEPFTSNSDSRKMGELHAF